jgi:hypothetical protein
MTTCAPLTADRGAVQLTFFQEESPAKDSAEQASSSESSTPATSGRTRSGSSKSAARRGSSSKTWTALHRSTIGASFSKTLRRQGMMLAGVCSVLEMWALPIFGKESGCSPQTQEPLRWQTPVADDCVERTAGKFNSRGEPKLSAQAQMWPTPTVCEMTTGCGYQKSGDRICPTLTGETGATPTASDGKGAGKNQHTLTLDRQVKNEEQPGGLLNPTWVEWLMGFPIGWTDPVGGPSSEDFHEWLESNRTALTAYVAAATVRFHSPSAQHGSC